MLPLLSINFKITILQLLFIISVTVAANSQNNYAIAIHGGAGALTKKNMTPELETKYREALSNALNIGEEILKKGGTSLDAVEQTIIYLENCPLFNAGVGAVFNYDGIHELDASVMNGKTLQAGAVGSLQHVKNPIRAARKVMEFSPHVFMVGAGAEKFALEQGLDSVSNTFFDTPERLKEFLKNKQDSERHAKEQKRGTVGCVALDRSGNLAAGTSTGGMSMKKYGRIGDSPVIGAGTYANNNSCAVSCTGHGEYFIRYAVAYDVSARMLYNKQSLTSAADEVINKVLKDAGGDGGLIAVDKHGNITTPFNSEGMYRGWAKPGLREIKIYKE